MRTAGNNLSGMPALLQCGETLVFRPRGNSMSPRIKDRALVTVEPLPPLAHVHIDDVVLARVRGRVVLHLVSALRSDDHVQISNNKGHVNGWTPRKNVYGIVTKVET